MVLKINIKTVIGKYDFKFTLKKQLVNAILRLIFKTPVSECDFKKQKDYFYEFFESKST